MYITKKNLFELTNNSLKLTNLQTYSTDQNIMVLYLNSSTPYVAFPSAFTRDAEGNVLDDYEFRVPISVEEEDIDMAKNIGILPLDKYDPGLGEDMEIEFLLMVAKEEGEGAGQLMLEFTEKPFQFRRWIVVDAVGMQTSVTLLNLVFDTPIPNAVFSLPSYTADN